MKERIDQNQVEERDRVPPCWDSNQEEGRKNPERGVGTEINIRRK